MRLDRNENTNPLLFLQYEVRITMTITNLLYRFPCSLLTLLICVLILSTTFLKINGIASGTLTRICSRLPVAVHAQHMGGDVAVNVHGCVVEHDEHDVKPGQQRIRERHVRSRCQSSVILQAVQDSDVMVFKFFDRFPLLVPFLKRSLFCQTRLLNDVLQ